MTEPSSLARVETLDAGTVWRVVFGASNGNVLDAAVVAELTGVISPEVSIPEVSEEIQNAVKSYVRRVVGVEVAEVRIHVENISNDSRRSRLD